MDVKMKKRKLESTDDEPNKRVKCEYLKDTHPDIFNELSPKLNPDVDLDKITLGSAIKLIWKCQKHTTCDEHVWTGDTKYRIRSLGCRKCLFEQSTKAKHCKCIVKKLSKPLLKDHPLFKEVHPTLNNNVDITKISLGSVKKLFWMCSNHTSCNEHVWKARVINRTTKNGSGCTFCAFDNNHGGNKKIQYCVCTRPTFLNVDGTQKSNVIMKRCSNKLCRMELPISEFNTKKSRPDGLSSCCKKCNKKIGKQIFSVKQAMIKLFFNTHPCVDCKESNVHVLECDHINPEQKSKQKNGIKVRSMNHNSLKQLPIELKKCEVRCAFHHRLKTQNNIPYHPAKHYGYVKKNREAVRHIKVELKKCQHCNRETSYETAPAFDFDHIDGTKKTNGIHEMMSTHSLEEIKKELENCRLLCANCHRLVTAKQQKWRNIDDFDQDILQEAKTRLGVLYVPNH